MWPAIVRDTGVTNEKDELHIFHPIGMTHLPADLVTKAKKELGETDEKVKTGIKIIRDLLEENNVSFLENDTHVLRFLRIRKFMHEKSFQSIKNYVDIADIIRQEFGSIDPEAVRRVLKSSMFGLMPYKDAEGRAILFYRAGIWTPEAMSATDVAQTILAITFFLMEDPATQVSGLVLIMDIENASMYEISMLLKHIKIISMILKADPGRFKRVDVLKETSIFRFILRAAKMFLPAKLNQRITLHGNNTKNILEYYHPSVLPHEFGGTLGPLSNEHWIDKVDFVAKLMNDYIAKYSTVR